MTEIIETGLWLLLLWVVSVLAGWAWMRSRQRTKRPVLPELLRGADWKIIAGSGVYRVKYLGRLGGGFLVTAPTHQNAHVPLRPGETVTVEAPAKDLFAWFRATIIERDGEAKQLLIEFPQEAVVHNRREAARKIYLPPRAVQLNQEPAILLDEGPGGAKLISVAPLAAGDPVRLDDPESAGEGRYGYVLEVLPDALDGRPASRVRVIFADPDATMG